MQQVMLAQGVAAVVQLNQHHMAPVKRTAALMAELFNLPMAQATVIKTGESAGEGLQPTVDRIAQALQTVSVLHVDEIGLRVNKTLHWMLGAATETLPWVGLGRQTRP